MTFDFLKICFCVIATMGFLSCDKAVSDAPKEKQTLSDTLKPIKVDTKMILIKGGEYLPFYGNGNNNVTVAPFYMDERPVTNEEYLAFVTLNPQWRKSNVKLVYADSSYLKDWPDDLHLPAHYKLDAPICNISWFAAKAFATSIHKRLPTLDEWEFVAMADETDFNARKKKSYSDNIVDLFLIKDKQYNAVKQSPANAWGIYNMFDLAWEWTDDFNSILTTGDSRNGTNKDNNLFCAGGATSATDVLNYAAFMRFGLRTSLKANYTVSNLGFRCAKDY